MVIEMIAFAFYEMYSGLEIFAQTQRFWILVTDCVLERMKWGRVFCVFLEGACLRHCLLLDTLLFLDWRSLRRTRDFGHRLCFEKNEARTRVLWLLGCCLRPSDCLLFRNKDFGHRLVFWKKNEKNRTRVLCLLGCCYYVLLDNSYDDGPNPPKPKTQKAHSYLALFYPNHNFFHFHTSSLANTSPNQNDNQYRRPSSRRSKWKARGAPKARARDVSAPSGFANIDCAKKRKWNGQGGEKRKMICLLAS